ncbi:MAG: hypothetical protein N2441_07865 [Rhodocyclaceae bacterium]|nr:hypothetical protein [Rhodocyclaceae bacterium]
MRETRVIVRLAQYVGAFIVLLRLMLSPRYRAIWAEAAEELAASNDACAATLRRLAASRNGGRPLLRVVRDE